jgi:regulator of protease activity HflC (stomatin/prohibitin superfamily)
VLDRDGKVVLDAAGEPQVADEESGIGFPSKDGFKIQMDFTSVWGIMPAQAPDAIRKFGNVAMVEQKIVVPQIESICRNKGSELGAVELLVGLSRQKFQEETTHAFHDALEKNNLTLLYGLVRDIHIPLEVRLPIQRANLADELRLTRDQEQLTARTEGKLREAERKVELEAEKVRAETEKLVAETRAKGAKTAAETRADTLRLAAEIDKETAGIEAQATIVRGEAESGATKLLQEAKADKFALAVKAFGSGQSFNQWTFASRLPDDIKLQLLYAGPGTFWTDLKGLSETLLGRQAAQAK